MQASKTAWITAMHATAIQVSARPAPNGFTLDAPRSLELGDALLRLEDRVRNVWARACFHDARMIAAAEAGFAQQRLATRRH